MAYVGANPTLSAILLCKLTLNSPKAVGNGGQCCDRTHHGSRPCHSTSIAATFVSRESAWLAIADSRNDEPEELRRGWRSCYCPIHACGSLSEEFERKNTERVGWDEAKPLPLPGRRRVHGTANPPIRLARRSTRLLLPAALRLTRRPRSSLLLREGDKITGHPEASEIPDPVVLLEGRVLGQRPGGDLVELQCGFVPH